ncbi:MAG: pyridoxal phosphate-dependent aminotransferase [Spirochaetia bacterium]|nr:pyridoxal phosphate-dependent aminotransferase [Spirochaetota bacterium]MCX8096092.1 pyridoxal phosphate-dependent aminotransferase [Spirochaetota bacterium]MDW8113105.1 pyridoxal phosphate-dependent aminotransferase [Spirochaetia bacterium]
MSFSLSKISVEIEQSPTLALSTKTKELISKGLDVINLTAGESDLPVPDWVIRNLEMYVKTNGTNNYKPTAGLLELRKEISEKYKRFNNVDYSSKNVVVSIGAKQSLYLALASICNPNDEVIVISPYWVSYVEQIKIVGAKPVIFKTRIQDGFIPDVKKLESLISSKTKAIIINSPNNPTGVVYDPDVLEKVLKLAIERKFYIISDEIYEDYVYDGKFVSIASLSPEAREITITINGFSKSHSITGWRIGYACASEEIASIMDSIQSHISSGTSSIVQYAMLKFLEHYEENRQKIHSEFKSRRDFVKQELLGLDNVKVFVPQGAFYYFLDVSGCYDNRIKTSVTFCSELLDKKLVSVVPGSAFGDDNFIRLSFATSIDKLKEGIRRFKEFVLSG